MSQHDFDLANGSGAAVRSDLNLAIKALASLSSGSTDPITATGVTYAYQLWVDTSGGSPLLKIRNGANNAWITLGTASLANLGMLALATGGTMAAAILFSNTDYTGVPSGTTGQRPGSPTVGMIRYNSTLTCYECYFSGGWFPFGLPSLGSLGAETLTSNRVMTAADEGIIFLVNSATAIQITLPPNKANSKFSVKDIGGQAGTNNITIVRNASESIEGVAATLTLQANYGAWSFVSDSSFNWWMV